MRKRSAALGVLLALPCALLLTGCATTPSRPGGQGTATVTAYPVSAEAHPAVEQVAAEDCAPLVYGLDGDFGNTICPDGRANVAAVDELRRDRHVTMDLDPYATEQQVFAALCADNPQLTIPERITLYSVAQALNRWQFVEPVLDSLGNLRSTCSNE